MTEDERMAQNAADERFIIDKVCTGCGKKMHRVAQVCPHCQKSVDGEGTSGVGGIVAGALFVFLAFVCGIWAVSSWIGGAPRRSETDAGTTSAKRDSVASLATTAPAASGQVVAPAVPATCKDAERELSPIEPPTYVDMAAALVLTNDKRTEFETEQEFRQRRRNEETQIETKAKSLGPDGLVKTLYDLGPLAGDYDIDKHLLTVKPLNVQALPEKRWASLRALIVSQETQQRGYFDDKIKFQDTDSYAVAYTPPKSVPFLRGKKPVRIPMAVDEAKRAKGNMQLALIGKLVPPFVLKGKSNFKESPIPELPHQFSFETFIILRPSCAAIVRKSDHRILWTLMNEM